MEDVHHLTTPKKSWSKLMARSRKWLSLKNRHNDFQSDCYIIAENRRKSCSDENCFLVVPDDFSDWAAESDEKEKLHVFKPEAKNESPNLKMFIGTWNVGGKSPPKDLDLQPFLKFPAYPADVYVLGFQEIIPLNAGNVLGAEDRTPADEWLSLIRRTLNSNTPNDESSPPSNEFEHFYKYSLDEMERDHDVNPKYCLAASKQMVGLFLCVWVRSELVGKVEDIKVSCVGRGIMGYLGNKGSVSVSMNLYNTSFCFVCTHLASGEKEGNEVRRNLDVLEILRKTRFGMPYKDGILEHDNVIWLGDLNYRLACDRSETHELVKLKDWQTLLQKDQLRMEQRAGRVFKGWKEGIIRFSPTYKYLPDSDQYVSQSSASKEKPRTPAWCDRILWRGNGLKQMAYDRDETRFSDHRPVYSIFTACIDNHVSTIKHELNTEPIKSRPTNSSSFSNSTRAARIRAEELFILTRAQSCVRGNNILACT